MGIDAFLKRLSQKLSVEPGSTALLSRVNRDLKSLHLGIELFLDQSPVCIDADPTTEAAPPRAGPGGWHSAWVLGYAKVGGTGWCLAVRQVLIRSGTSGRRRPEEVVPRGDPKSLLSVPLHVQIAAAALVPKLLDLIRQEVRVTLRSIEWARLMPETLELIGRSRSKHRPAKDRPH